MFILLQKLLPQKFLSRVLGQLAHCKNSIFKKWAIQYFIRYFGVDLSESLITDVEKFASFNDFFIRQLKPNARTLPKEDHAIACPADGMISELGAIKNGKLIQAKHHFYSLSDLLGENSQALQMFNEGLFFTVYLAPKNYHRVHLPLTGSLKQMIYIPGKLYSVNPRSANHIPKLFAGNERVVCVFETHAGPMAVIFVGALLIGSVVTAWHGQVMPSKEGIFNKIYQELMIFQRGEEAGYFQWGSTVIVLFGAHQVAWNSQLQAGDAVKMGQTIGTIL